MSKRRRGPVPLEVFITRVSAMMVGVALAAMPTGVFAHRLDEVLLTSQVSIEPTRIVIDVYVTPGVLVARQFLENLDPLGDGVNDTDLDAFAAALLRRFTLWSDGVQLKPMVVAADAAPTADLLEGTGAVHVSVEAGSDGAAGQHFVEIANLYEPGVSIYLANAMLPPSDRVAIHAQTRDERQQRLRVDYSVAPRAIWPFGILAATLALAAAAYWRRRSSS